MAVDGGEQVSRALAIMDQFYLSMMESEVLKIVAFQYECYSEISEETYMKFLTNFTSLAAAIKKLNQDILNKTTVDVGCQTAFIDPPVTKPAEVKTTPVRPLVKVNKVVVRDINPTTPLSAVVAVGNSSTEKRAKLVCDYCDQTCSGIESLVNHTRQVHGDQFSKSVFSCSLCDQQFLSTEALHEHNSCAHNVKDEHSKEEGGEQLCFYCAELASSWDDLAAHLTEKHDSYMCMTCHIICDDLPALTQHIEATHINGIVQCIVEETPSPPPVPRRAVGRPPTSTIKAPTPIASTTPRKRGRPRKEDLPVIMKQEFTCNVCDYKCMSEESLKNHITYRHIQIEGDLICKKCNLKFRRRTALDNHMRIIHHKQHDLWVYPEEKTAIKHAKTEVEESTERSPQKMLTSKMQLKPSLMRTKESPQTKPSQEVSVSRVARMHCEVCGEICTQAEDQEIHKDHHATRRMDQFLCLYCTAPAMSQHELRTHIVSEHRYKCPFCSLTFWWRSNLESHLVQLHTTKDMCPSCQIHMTGAELRKHILQDHSARKHYICKLCGSAYLTVREMHEHEMTHSNGLDKQAMKCDLCKRCFGTRNRLKGHLLRHLHGAFCCHLCGQQCHTQEQLSQHLVRHQKSQFACFCGKRFATKPELQNHQRSNSCKQGLLLTPKADILVEVRVPKEDDSSMETSLTAPIMHKITDAKSSSNIWQINIALPPEEATPLSRDFLTALAHTVEPEAASLDNERQQILILGEDGVATTSFVDEQTAEVVQWLKENQSQMAIMQVPRLDLQCESPEKKVQ